MVMVEEVVLAWVMVSLADCDLPGTPNEIFYTQEQAANKACLYARLVELRTGL